MSGEQEVIRRHLLDHAARYCPDGAGPARVALIRSRRRAAAALYWYRIERGAGSRVVVAKVPGAPADHPGDAATRPRLAEPPALATKYEREYRALSNVASHFDAALDPRFGAVPLLGRVDAARALIMGEVAGQPMTRLAYRLGRLHPRGPGSELRRAIGHAGAWLRAYHGLEPDQEQSRQSRRDEVIDLIHRYCDHLGGRLARRPWFHRLAGTLEDAAASVLPPRLPLGLAHGDFAMRNILVEPGGRVVVLDTTAMWRAPVYEDLAKFAVAMRTSRAQTYSHGLALSPARLRAAHGWLLTGYYGHASVPMEPIRLYVVLLLLDKWSFELALPPRGPRAAAAARRRLVDAWMAREVASSARALAAAVGARAPAETPSYAGGPDAR